MCLQREGPARAEQFQRRADDPDRQRDAVGDGDPHAR
jgi:hypothetical protein